MRRLRKRVWLLLRGTFRSHVIAYSCGHCGGAFMYVTDCTREEDLFRGGGGRSHRDGGGRDSLPRSVHYGMPQHARHHPHRHHGQYFHRHGAQHNPLANRPKCLFERNRPPAIVTERPSFTSTMRTAQRSTSAALWAPVVITTSSSSSLFVTPLSLRTARQSRPRQRTAAAKTQRGWCHCRLTAKRHQKRSPRRWKRRTAPSPHWLVAERKHAP